MCFLSLDQQLLSSLLHFLTLFSTFMHRHQHSYQQQQRMATKQLNLHQGNSDCDRLGVPVPNDHRDISRSNTEKKIDMAHKPIKKQIETIDLGLNSHYHPKLSMPEISPCRPAGVSTPGTYMPVSPRACKSWSLLLLCQTRAGILDDTYVICTYKHTYLPTYLPTDLR